VYHLLEARAIHPHADGVDLRAVGRHNRPVAKPCNA
jgi:hypothetical protein